MKKGKRIIPFTSISCDVWVVFSVTYEAHVMWDVDQKFDSSLDF